MEGRGGRVTLIATREFRMALPGWRCVVDGVEKIVAAPGDRFSVPVGH